MYGWSSILQAQDVWSHAHLGRTQEKADEGERQEEMDKAQVCEAPYALFTKWSQMGAVFSSDHVDETSDKEYNISVELKVSFTYPGLNDLQQ